MPELRVFQNCLFCKKDFGIYSSRLKQNRGKYCSKRCFDISQEKKEVRNCLTCNKIIIKHPSTFRAGRYKFCSIKCSAKRRRTWIEYICISCNKKFIDKKCRNRQYCSRFCWHTTELLKEIGRKNSQFIPHLKGKDNPNWKGGITPMNKAIRNSMEYKYWRELVFKRDDYTCQMCEKRGVELHADHIKPFSLYPDLRLTIENGQTLCIPCHRKTDTYGGRICLN